ncbi:MAG TPA: hypothetical protein PKZ56_02350 [Candidatus Paceibacterota bacterium]|nr:hypothetical protein [Candidatus Paceibacterota bacterium]
MSSYNLFAIMGIILLFAFIGLVLTAVNIAGLALADVFGGLGCMCLLAAKKERDGYVFCK